MIAREKEGASTVQGSSENYGFSSISRKSEKRQRKIEKKKDWVNKKIENEWMREREIIQLQTRKKKNERISERGER